MEPVPEHVSSVPGPDGEDEAISEKSDAFPDGVWETKCRVTPAGSLLPLLPPPGRTRSGAEFGSSLMGALRARVLVVDDSDVFLRAAASVILATSTLRLIGAVGSGDEAIRLLPQLRPDLVLVDFHMPGMNGVQTT